MQFCDECGSMLDPTSDGDLCSDCAGDSEIDRSRSDENDEEDNSLATTMDRAARLKELETTESGTVKKRNAVGFVESLDEPTEEEIEESITVKPEDFEGSTFPTDISNVRVTGDAEFVATMAGLFKPFLDMEDHQNRLEINLQEIEDRDTGELTGNYALYLSVAERG